MTVVLVPALIRLHLTVAGGRRTGYRSTCVFEGVVATDGAERFGFELQLVDRERIEPGDTARCRLRVWAGDALPTGLAPGTEIRFFEGVTEVAVGEVLRGDESPSPDSPDPVTL